MKKYTLLLLLPLLFSLSNCKKDDGRKDPIDQLPPATQTGVGTFAALVDGKPFTADNPWFNCFYQFMDGEYYFGIQGRNSDEMMRTIILGTNAKTISEGEIMYLTENEEGNAWGGGRFNLSDNTTQGSYTNYEYKGELTITKLDFTNNIVSGAFWFDIEHPVTGERVKIREGRFDTLFTQ